MPGTGTVVTPRDESAELEAVLAHVRRARGLPLELYRRPMIERRVGFRRSRAGVPDLAAYLRLLERDPRELDDLISAVCIQVSRFFRDGPVFERLASFLRERAACGAPVRVWSAGCARGEEAWSLALLLDAAGVPPGSTVLATDVDPRALASGTAGVYPREVLADVPEALRERFARHGERSVRPSVGAGIRVEFRAHDLASSTPPDGGPFDLVLCRNVLIYFTRELQARVETLLAGSLKAGGLLCLGEAEWIGRPADRGLDTIDRRLRLFERRRPSETP